MPRRRNKVDALTVIYWRDIPAQVTASMAGETGKALLPPRFQHAIDRAAAVADLTETSAYVAQWRRVEEPIEASIAGEPSNGRSGRSPDDMALARADELDGLYPRERLEAHVANGGLTPDGAPT